MATTAHHKRMRMHHHATARHGKTARGASPSDNMANQLNAQELGRVGGSSPPSRAQPNPTQGGDYHTDTFPKGYDVVLVSNTLHQEDDESCLRIMKEAYEALEDNLDDATSAIIRRIATDFAETRQSVATLVKL